MEMFLSEHMLNTGISVISHLLPPPVLLLGLFLAQIEGKMWCETNACHLVRVFSWSKTQLQSYSVSVLFFLLLFAAV